jgi:hypothetical protein
MRMLQKVVAGAAVAAATLALVAGVAVADPPTGVTPSATSIVGVGSRTTEYLLDQLALNYDAAHRSGTQIYSIDACLGRTPCGGNVVTKKGCKPISRESINGTSAGISALEANSPEGKSYCIDFARSSRGPEGFDPTDITFVPLALDNVTYATLAKGSNVPTNLTTVQLHKIYSCDVTRPGYKDNTWGALLGPKAKKGTRNIRIAPYLPQPGSEDLSFFWSATSALPGQPGRCWIEPATLEENEGVNPVFASKNAPNILIPYSAGRWVAQQYHSAACARKGCPAANGQNVVIECKTPTVSQNLFGCDVNGVLRVNDIDGTSPVTGKVLNPKFTPRFIETLYDVVRGADSIPRYLQKFFGPKGAFCSKPYQSVIRAYGFRADPACGSLTAG